MRKTYIFDTSILIYDPYSWKQFPNSDIIIPIAVLNELDKLKKQAGEAGRNARVAIRMLDEISDALDISTGIMLENDILMKVDAQHRDLSDPFYAGFGEPGYGDTQILACAFANWQEHPENDVTLVSNDINLRVKAKSRNLDAIAHDDSKHSVSDLYMGHQVSNNVEAAEKLLQFGDIDPADYGITLHVNECVAFVDDNGDILCMGRLVEEGFLQQIKKVFPWNISSRNKEQAYAMNLIMDPDVDLVTLIGKAGTGKSLVVLASALELVISKKQYEKFIIYRPIQPVGNDIGFLPGTMEEKLGPWFQAILDNFEVLFTNKFNRGSNSNSPMNWKRELQQQQERGRIEMEAITYIRGRSIANAIILVDECQNLTKDDVKTILTRAGENTKIILTGDIEQIDNHLLDATDNGLTYVIEKFKGSELAGHVTFTQGERSRLATKAAEIL